MKTFSIILLLLTLILAGCSPTPKPIEFGKDICEHCSMTIAETKWGAEIVTDKGKVYKFDSIECMAAFFLIKANKTGMTFHSFWTINYANPGELIDAKKAFYIKSKILHSPMGLNVASFKTEPERQKFKTGEDDLKLNWNDVVRLVKTEW